jgi:hypothetical protein
MMPGSGHTRRGIWLLLLGVCGTALLVWTVISVTTQTKGPYTDLLFIIGGITGILPLTVAGINFWQGAQANKLYRDEAALARWTLSQAEQQANAEAVYQGEKPTHAVLFGANAILIALSFVVKLTAFQNMGWGPFILILLGLMAIILYIWFVIPRLKRRRMRSDSPDVVIGLRGAVLPGQYVLWNKRQAGMVAARLNAVSLVREGGGDVLIVGYETLARGGYVKESCRIPVPDGNRAEAAQAGRKIAETGRVKFRNETETPKKEE